MDLYNRLELGDFHNIKDEEYDTFLHKNIYQILPLEYVKHILKNQVFRFNNIKAHWDDPYELFLFKQHIHVDGKDWYDSYNEWLSRYYGQCWSLNKDTDAMWRIYSHDKRSVQIKTTILDFIKVLDQTRGIMWTGPTFGRVVYKTKEEVIDFLRRFEEDGFARSLYYQSDSLFIKRKEFEHEKEIRFLLWQSTSYPVRDFLELDISEYNVIKEIVLDPRLSDEECEEIKQELSSINDSIPIVQSQLYKFDQMNIYLKYSHLIVPNALDAYNKRHKLDK